jgi:hypothetical protein
MTPEVLEALYKLHQRTLRSGSPLVPPGLGAFFPPSDGRADHEREGTSEPAGRAADPSLLDVLRAQQLIVEELFRIQALLLRIVAQPWAESLRAGTASVSPGDVPASHPPDATASLVGPLAPDEPRATENAPPIDELLRGAERLLLLHPVAAQAGFSALVAQGRRFAATPEGAQLAQALSTAPVLARLRRIWETTTLNMLEERSTKVVPNMYVEAIFRAARSANLEDLLRTVRPTEEGR